MWQLARIGGPTAADWLAHLWHHMRPGGLYVIGSYALVLGDLGFAYVTDAWFVDGAPTTDYLVNLRRYAMATLAVVVLAASPVGLMASAQVITHAHLGGPVFVALAYVPLGAVCLALPSLLWWPVRQTLLACERERNELNRYIDELERCLH